MLRSLLLSGALVCLFAGCASSETATVDPMPGSEPAVLLAEFDGGRVTLDEFETQYLRTTTDTMAAVQDSMAAFEDFLERYVDFKLKVLAAEAAGYAERADLTEEMATYRSQLARPYLLEQEVIEPLIQQLYDRKREMVDVSHILIRVTPDAAPRDTLRAYEQLSVVVDSLEAGGDFAELAFRNSQDPSASGDPNAVGYRGRLGPFRGGRMVKPFEDRMFATPVDSVSDIFRTQFGYHILRVNDRMEATPDVRVSHIMIQPRGQAPADSADALQRVQEALSRLQAGESFAEVAADLSDDQSSAQKGGDLDFVGYDGWLPPAMRDAVFGLDSLNTVAGPISTRFGYHLVTVTDRREAPSFEDSYDSLKEEVARLPRAQEAEKAYARSLRRQYGASVDSSLVYYMLGTSSPDSLVGRALSGTLPDSLGDRTIATLGDSTYSTRAFLLFAAGQRGQRQPSAQARLEANLDAFLSDRAIAYEVDQLEARDESFRRTMKEFRDGLMLFRLMEDSVWTAAAQDSAALRTWFQDHQAEYSFPDRVRILSISSRSDSLMTVITRRMDEGLPYGAVMDAYRADSTVSVRFDTTYVEGPTDSVYDQALDLPQGGISRPLAYAGGRILLVNDGIEPARPKTFQEARAEVVTAWQEVVEDRLMARLRGERNARLYPGRLDRAFEDYRGGSASE